MPRKKSLQREFRDLAIQFADGLAKAVENRIASQRPHAAAAPAGRAVAPKRRVTARSSASGREIEKAKAKLLAEINRTPGLRSEQLQKATKLPAPVAARALAELRDASAVKTKGQRRATTYSPK